MRIDIFVLRIFVIDFVGKCMLKHCTGFRSGSLLVVRPLTVAVAVLGAAMVVIPAPGAHAQQTGAQIPSAPLAIAIAPETQLQPGVAAAMPIRINAPKGVPKNVILLIRGMPAGIALSEGRPFGPGVWAVPTASADRLRLAAAETIVGVSVQITISLESLEGTKLAEAKTTLRVMPGVQTGARQEVVGDVTGGLPRTPPVETAAKPVAPPSSSSPPTMSSSDRAEMSKLVEKGHEVLKTGKIAAARLLYKRAAEAGLAEAALALGATYDAKELARLSVVGSEQADAALARKWYSKASEMGSTEAARRVQQAGN